MLCELPGVLCFWPFLAFSSGFILLTFSFAVPEFSFPIPFERLSRRLSFNNPATRCHQTLARHVCEHILPDGTKSTKTAHPFESLKPNWRNRVKGNICCWHILPILVLMVEWWNLSLMFPWDPTSSFHPPFFLIVHIAKRISQAKNLARHGSFLVQCWGSTRQLCKFHLNRADYVVFYFCLFCSVQKKMFSQKWHIMIATHIPPKL